MKANTAFMNLKDIHKRSCTQNTTVENVISENKWSIMSTVRSVLVIFTRFLGVLFVKNGSNAAANNVKLSRVI